MKSLIKALLKKTPYRFVRRTSLNRFQAVEDSLVSLQARGYRPRRIIDGGANEGTFTKHVLGLFPGAVVHAIEPQPACQPKLEEIAAKVGDRLVRHAIALCAPENEGQLLTIATDYSQRSTGAHVTVGVEVPLNGRQIAVPCSTLDAALSKFCKVGDRTLLKLDLQGYELHGLRGGIATLSTTEVVLVEISFFAQAYEPSIHSLVAFLSLHGFDLYDVASIFARPRDNRPRQGDLLFVKRTCDLAQDSSWD